MSELDWMQRYAAAEMVEMNAAGRMSRREMMRWLTSICGSTAAAAAFLAACSSDSNKSSPATTASTASTGEPSSSTSTAPETTTSTTADDPIQPYTGGPAGRVLSVAADDPDVDAESIEYPGPAGTMFGYVARPANSDAPTPGIIVIHEIFGLNDHIRDVARRLAKVGYLAIAPDLVSRAGGTDNAADPVGTLVGSPVADRVADMDATADRLAEEAVYNGKLGVVGFCFGGGMTWSYAAAQPKVLAAVPYYGPIPQPVADLRNVKAAVMAHFAETDNLVNGSIADLEANAPATFEKRTWKGTGHAFNNDTGAAYNERAAIQAWKATLGWFAHQLV